MTNAESSPVIQTAEHLAKLMANLKETVRTIDQEKVYNREKKTREVKRERKDDTRRKIILGGVLLAELREAGPLTAALIDLLNRRVTSARDRALVQKVVPIDDFLPPTQR